MNVGTKLSETVHDSHAESLLMISNDKRTGMILDLDRTSELPDNEFKLF